MSEAEKQEGQKTVVAFITGLLIGGLLVWVFSSSPESAPTENGAMDDTAEETDAPESGNDSEDMSDRSDAGSMPVADKGGDEPAVSQMVTGDGRLSVNNQSAGTAVMITNAVYPDTAGWIVVRDYVDGTPGSVLGAARYSVSEGLDPTQVELLRATEAGNTYQVVFYTEDGDNEFNLRSDRMIEGVGATFTAN